MFDRLNVSGTNHAAINRGDAMNPGKEHSFENL